MSSVSDKTVVRTRSTPPPALRLSHWPLKQEPIRSALVLLSIGGVAALCGGLAMSFGVGLLVGGLLAFTVRRLWMPVEFELGTRGIVYSSFGRKRRVPWTEFAGYRVHDGGVLLSVDRDVRPFSSLRGLFISFGGRRSELLTVLDFYLPGDEEKGIDPGTNDQKRK